MAGVVVMIVGHTTSVRARHRPRPCRSRQKSALRTKPFPQV
jgi:hypothetical protein